MRGLPIGVSDFKRIRRNGSLYVDKTGLIIDIVENMDTAAFLFTRPRRFGKSLNLSMLDAFFNMEYAGNDWFDGLEVSGSEACRRHRNAYPVVFISLKDVIVRDRDSFRGSMRSIIERLYGAHPCLCGSSALDPVLRRRYDAIVGADPGDAVLEYAVRDLCDMLAAHHGRPVVVLIDEYDNPANRAEGEMRSEVLRFMRTFVASTLKDNGSMVLGVATGVMQISKESIFGLNNLYLNSVFSQDMSERFGSTEEEVNGIVAESGRTEMMGAVKEWYDGYRFGDSDIYNPWSILNCVRRGFEMRPYWIWEGDPSIILDSMRRTGFESVDVLTRMYNGEPVVTRLRDRAPFDEIASVEGLLSLMVASGYLKATRMDDGRFSLSLPNREVRDGLMEQLMSSPWGHGQMNEVSAAILKGDPDGLRMFLQDSLDRSVDVSKLRDEYDYGFFALGLLDCLGSTHFVKPERGAGKGYADIVVVPRDGRGASAVLELKRSRGGSLERAADGAIAQIEERRYFADLRGEVLLYGVAFERTDVAVSFERMTMRRHGRRSSDNG